MKKKQKTKQLISALLISFMLTNIIFIVIISANSVYAQVNQITQTKLKEAFKFISNPIIGFLFGVWDFSQFQAWETAGLQAGVVSAMVTYFMVWLILFVAFSDAVSLVSPFSTWVSWVIGLGLTIIIAQVQVIFGVARWIFVGVAGFGILGIVISLIAAFVMLIALSFGSTWARRAIIRIKMARAVGKAYAGSESAAEAIKGLGRIETAMEEAGKR